MCNWRTKIIISILLTIPIFRETSGQDILSPEQKESAIVKRWGFLTREYPKTNPEIFKIIRAHYPGEIQAMIKLGDAELEKQNWKQADYWYGICLFRDPDNLQANYGCGICRREIGVFRFPLQRLFDWKKAKKHFRQAVALDSAYKDVLYQWALLERYQQNYFKAIELANRQLHQKIRPYYAEKGIYRLYDAMIGNVPEEEAEPWLHSRNTEFDIYFLGELYRRMDNYQRADSVFRLLGSTPRQLSRHALLLSFVRLYTQQNQPQKAHDNYWEAVESIHTVLAKDLIIEDLMYIINENEYAVLESDMPFQRLPEILRKIWLRRDPMPAAPYNHRLIEHYRRILFAEKYYRYDGFRHQLYRDDRLKILSFPKWYTMNYKLNDLGLIYIRFGKPDEEATELYDPKLTNMSWLYVERTDRPKLIFHFSIPEIAPTNCWMLMPGFTDKMILSNLVHWDPMYHRLYNARGIEIMREWGRLSDMSAKMVDRGFRTDTHSWDKETRQLDVYEDIAQFRQSTGEDLLQIAFGIPVSSLFLNQDWKDTVTLETAVSFFDNQLNTRHKEVHTFHVASSLDPHIFQDYFIDEFEIRVPLEPQNIAMHARIPETNSLNYLKFVYPISDSARNELACSSLKIAFDITPLSDAEKYTLNTLSIIPNPTKIFKRSDAIFICYEISLVSG
jgi:tetratricopeptide (TPR) repeat protein